MYTLFDLWSPMLAAIEPKSIMAALFVLFAIGSWLWNVINGQPNQGGAVRRVPPQMGRRPAEQDLQAEINRFLKQALGQKEPAEVDLEVLEEAAEVKPSPRTKARRPASTPKSQPNKLADLSPSRDRPGGKIARRKGPGSTDLGSNVREHAAEHMQDRLVKQTEQHFAHGVSEKVQRDLGPFTAGIAAAGAGSAEKKSEVTTPKQVIAMLRSPATVKQAVILNMILSRPVTGRRIHR